MRYCETQNTLVALVGEPNTIKLMQTYGGRDIYVPSHHTLKLEHDIVVLIGYEAAKRLCRYYDGTNVTIPLGKAMEKAERNEMIYQMFLDGKSKAELVKLFGMTERNIRKIINQKRFPPPERPKPPQLDLF